MASNEVCKLTDSMHTHQVNLVVKHIKNWYWLLFFYFYALHQKCSEVLKLCKFHVLCKFYVIEINIFDTIFAFVLQRIYKLENWLILADHLVNLAGRSLYFNHFQSISITKIQTLRGSSSLIFMAFQKELYILNLQTKCYNMA